MRDKIFSNDNIPPPSTKKLMHSFLGLIPFYKSFIPQSSEYPGPLSNLPKKATREPFTWSEVLLDCFIHLKLALSTALLLRLPKPSLTFVLRTHASSHGLAFLLQYHDECPHPVSYANRKLLDREKKIFYHREGMFSSDAWGCMI